MNDKDRLMEAWHEEENAAHIHGWDFSHIHGRYTEEDDLPWDYEAEIRRWLKPCDSLLDMDTGGGEFLLSLGHPHGKTAATEYYAPNVKLCGETLLPLGIDFREADASGALPFDDGAFDIAINRHGSFNEAELARVLSPGGVFITEQVGALNDRELVDMVLPGLELPFPDITLDRTVKRFSDAGFDILRAEEAFRPIRFFDTGAFVWFARIIEWEFPGFSVDRCAEKLFGIQERIEANGFIEGRIHRFILTAARRKAK